MSIIYVRRGASRGASQGASGFASGVAWRIIPAEAAHIAPIALNMRASDQREVWAAHRHTPQEALRRSLACSELAWTCLVREEPAFMWGVGRPGNLRAFVGLPWLLGTEAMRKVEREFLRQSKPYVAAMQERFPCLENYVHAENELSQRWLKWCGFSLEEQVVFLNNEAFKRFWRGAECVSQ